MTSGQIQSGLALVETLRKVKPAVLSDFNVEQIELFGSFVRNSATDDSDIDLLVTFDDDASLFDLIRLKLFMEEYLGRAVDVVPKESLRVELKENVLRETIVI